MVNGSFVLFWQRFSKFDIKNEKLVKCFLQKCYKNCNTQVNDTSILQLKQ